MDDSRDNQAVYMLPDEMLLKIFAYLSRQELGRVAQVCKRWRSVSYDPVFYESVELSRAAYEPGTLGFVLGRGTRQLQVKGQASEAAFKGSPFVGGRTYGSNCCLQTLYSSSLREGVNLILQRSRHLTDVRLVMQTMIPQLMLSLADLRGLIHLRILSKNRGPSLKETAAVATSNRKLRVYNCHGYANTLNDAEIYTLIKELPPTIEETNLFCSSEYMSDLHVAMLVSRLPNLRELHLQRCPKLTALSLKCISLLTQLEKLNFTLYPDFNIKGFTHLNSIKSMKTLALFGEYEGFAFYEIKKLLPNIKVTTQVYLSMFCENRH